ncbi:MAG: efflux RND transporter periplasmic adaptor subunit [Bacteroidetes bacterium]|nr:efflux RND transporter periplasmic adaptor subunit [Bacteroidota bacterium]
MKKNKIIFMLSAVILITACNHKEVEKEEDTTFLVSSPLLKDTFIYKEYVCQIRSIQHIELRALEKGYLQDIYVDEGQMVKKGQLMFQIKPVIYAAEMQKAQAEVEFAEIEYQNTKLLADKNVVSPNELALVKAKLSKAQAELALSKAHLGFTEIRAPFDGIMDRFNVRLGSLIDEGELLSTLSDNSKMWVYFNVPEAEYLNYTTRTNIRDIKVNLEMANHEMFDYQGTVETIEADFNNETGTIAFRATFPNPKRILRHGETGNILVPVNLKNAIIIPQKATFEVLDKKYVYVVGKDNVVRSQQITIGAEMPHLYVITEGLNETDKILIDGLRKVKNNEKIKYSFEDPKKVLRELGQLHAE